MALYFFILGVIILVGFGFFVSAFVSIVKNEQIVRDFKAVWLMFICLTGPIGVITYFFMYEFKTRAWVTLSIVIVTILMYLAMPFVAASYLRDKANDALFKIQNNESQMDILNDLQNSDEYNPLKNMKVVE